MGATLELDQLILQSVKRRGLLVAYHFIGLPYLPNLMKRNGLWCANRLREWRDQFDDDPTRWGTRAKGEAFGGYISCSVNPPMGMMKPNRRPLILELTASVLALPGTAFVGKWSSFRDVGTEALNQVGPDWFDRMFQTDKANRAIPHPGEFLVREHVPLSYVRRFIFYSDDDMRETRLLLEKTEVTGRTPQGTIKVAVEPLLFGRAMQETEDLE